VTELPLTCTLPIDPQAAADPTVIKYAFELAEAAMNKELAKAQRVIDGEVTQSWRVTRRVDGELIEFPWAPGEPTDGVLFIYLMSRANTVPA
jgi:hypothetical protein